MPDHIDPSAIPGDNLRPDMVEIAGSEISSIGDEVSDQGGVVVTTWQRLAQHYEAPEAGTLFGVMDPVKTNAETFGNNVDRVSSALKTYAAEVEPIKAELATIKAEAYSFVASIAGGVEKTTFSRAGAMTSTVEWHEDQDSVDANNDLIRRVNAQMVLLWAAERKCANAIYDIIGFPHIEAATEDNPNGYGVTEIPDGAETPWGKTVERSESCGEKAVDAVGRFVWDGVVVGGIWGTVVGLGTLTLGYNPQTGEWFDGDTYGAAWSNLGKLAVGLAVTSLPGTLMIANMPGPAGNFLRESQMTVLNAGKGLLAWDKWKDDPAAAAGEATFNVASILIPAGAATAPVRTGGSTAAAAIRTAARVMDVIDPASALIKVGTAGARIAIPAIADLVKSVDLSKIDIGNLGPGAKIDIPDMPQVEAPKIEVPSVARGDMTLDTPSTSNTADVPVRTVDTAATIPVREPALVGSGGTPTPIADGGHIGGSGSTPGGSGITPVAVAHCPTHRQVAVEIRLPVVAGPMVRPVGDPMVRPAVPTTGLARSGIRAKAIRCSPMLTMALGSRARVPTTSAATPSIPTTASRRQTMAGWARRICRRGSRTYLRTFAALSPIRRHRSDVTPRETHTVGKSLRPDMSMRKTASGIPATKAPS